MIAQMISSAQQDFSTSLKWLLIVSVSVYLLQYLVKIFFGKKIDNPIHQKTDYHMIRRLQHMLTGTLLLSMYPYFENKQFRLMALFIGFNIFGLHFLYRKINPKFNEQFVKNYGFLLRPHERDNLPGAFFFLFGQFLAELLYKYPVAQLSLAVLSYGDPFASLCGLYFTNSPKIIKGKTIAGTGACALVCGLVSTLIMYSNYASFELIRQQISMPEFFVFSCVIACLAELSYSNRKFYFDDNTSIPLFAGLYYSIYFYFRL